MYASVRWPITITKNGLETAALSEQTNSPMQVLRVSFDQFAAAGSVARISILLIPLFHAMCKRDAYVSCGFQADRPQSRQISLCLPTYNLLQAEVNSIIAVSACLGTDVAWFPS